MKRKRKKKNSLTVFLRIKRPAAKVSADEFSLVVAGSRNEPHNESVESDSESESESESDSDEEEQKPVGGRKATEDGYCTPVTTGRYCTQRDCTAQTAKFVTWWAY